MQAARPVELNELKEILQLVDESNIDLFELERAGFKLRLRKSRAARAALAPAVYASPAGSGMLPASASAAGVVALPSPAAPEGTIVASPIVGTFYRSPDPNSPPFVNVGDRVRVGQVLCIIEAMKLMNEIEAELAGEIVKIHPETGQPVQYGDALFTIKPEN